MIVLWRQPCICGLYCVCLYPTTRQQTLQCAFQKGQHCSVCPTIFVKPGCHKATSKHRAVLTSHPQQLQCQPRLRLTPFACPLCHDQPAHLQLPVKVSHALHNQSSPTYRDRVERTDQVQSHRPGTVTQTRCSVLKLYTVICSRLQTFQLIA